MMRAELAYWIARLSRFLLGVAGLISEDALGNNGEPEHDDHEIERVKRKFGEEQT